MKAKWRFFGLCSRDKGAETKGRAAAREGASDGSLKVQHRTERKRSAAKASQTAGELAFGSKAHIRRADGRRGDVEDEVNYAALGLDRLAAQLEKVLGQDGRERDTFSASSLETWSQTNGASRVF